MSTEPKPMRPIAIDCVDATIQPEPGPAPMLQWISLEQLVVDDSYQRDLKRNNWSAIRRIARAFKWSRFSPVFVAPVAGGKFAVIDGQHRAHAAAMVGITEVPCQIVQMDRAEQAAAFAAVNGLVTKVTLWQIYKAALSAGEPWAVECAAICADAGCTLMTRNGTTEEKKPGEIYALALIRSYRERGLGAAVTFALASLRRSEGGQEAASWANEVLKPTLQAVTERPWLIAQNADLAGFFDRFDIWAAIDRADEQARNFRRQGRADVSRYDLAAAQIGDALDKAFPQRMALPRRAA